LCVLFGPAEEKLQFSEVWIETESISLMEPYSTCSALPEPHSGFLRSAVDRLKLDSRVVAVAAGGSYLTQSIDEFSDLDLVIAIEPTAYETVLTERKEIAANLGPLLAAFTGEHVGEPRLLICLYGPPLLHVDLKFISLADAADRVEDPAILWERDVRLTEALRTGVARYPHPDLQWIEDRFWIWIHYGAAKVGRGELLEATGSLAYLRAEVLGPLSLLVSGERPSGVRKIEVAAPDLARQMQATVAPHNARECAAALRAAADMYRELRGKLVSNELKLNTRAEEAAMEYLVDIAARSGLSPAT
jgi:predicted nucleotidyltransferase